MRRGAQGAPGWIQRVLHSHEQGDRVQRIRDQRAACVRCGADLRFDVPDPLRIGRSMQSCTNAACDGRLPHPMPRGIQPLGS